MNLNRWNSLFYFDISYLSRNREQFMLKPTKLHLHKRAHNLESKIENLSMSRS